MGLPNTKFHLLCRLQPPASEKEGSQGHGQMIQVFEKFKVIF